MPILRTTILKSGGRISNVSIEEVTSPPRTTIARGFCTSLPTPEESSIGTSPNPAINAVISTGRNRRFAPITIVSSRLYPSLSSCKK